MRYNLPMPYLLAHTSFGKDVRAALGRHLPHDDEPLYYLGCLGPDIYFFDALPPTPFIPHQMRLGNRLHDTDAAELFAALTLHADARHVPFLCGMLCHLALDAAGNPWPVGHVLKNPELAAVLKGIAARGSTALLEGPVAQAIVDKVRKHPGNPGKLTLVPVSDRRPAISTADAKNDFGGYENE